MPTIERFQDLAVWQEARKFVYAVYQMTKEFPSNERHGLNNQMQRAAISIMSSIASGFERETAGEFINSLYAALGFTGEVRSQAYVALDLWYILQAECDDLVRRGEKLARCIRGLIEHLDSSYESDGGWHIEEPAR